jgi:hypothetical protein
MAKRTPPETLVRHDRKTMWAVAKYVEAFYVDSGKSDTEFAKQAQTHFEKPMTEYTIKAARNLLDLPSNTARPATKATADITARLNTIEAELAALSKRVEVYIKGCTGDRHPAK